MTAQTHTMAASGCAWRKSDRRRPVLLAVASPAGPVAPLLAALSRHGYDVRWAGSAAEAHHDLARRAPDLVLVAGEDAWEERLGLLHTLGDSPPQPPVVLVGHRETDFPAEAFTVEVADYLLLSEPLPAMVRRVDRALGRPSRRRTDAECRIQAYNFRVLCRIRELAAVCQTLLTALASLASEKTLDKAQSAGKIGEALSLLGKISPLGGKTPGQEPQAPIIDLCRCGAAPGPSGT